MQLPNLCFRTRIVGEIGSRNLSSYTTMITKVHRATYERTYPTTVVFQNSLSTTIRHHEPRQIIVLPMDVSSLTDDQKRAWMEKRRNIGHKFVPIETVNVKFDPKKYVNLKKTRK